MEILDNLNKLQIFWHKRVLFVCAGNICRSSAADGLLRHMLSDAGLSDKIYVDSAGMHGFHKGEKPDQRGIDVAAEDDIDLSLLQARKIDVLDFDKFDVIYAMDHGNFAELQALKPEHSTCSIEMFLNAGDVPDPWYGTKDDFYVMYDIIKKQMPHIITALTVDLAKD